MALRQRLCVCFGCALDVCLMCVCVLCIGPQLDVGTAPSSIFLLLRCSLVHSSASSFLCRWGKCWERNTHTYTRTQTHTYSHTLTDLGRFSFFPWKHRPWFIFVHLVEKWQQFEAKVLQGCERESCVWDANQINCGENAGRTSCLSLLSREIPHISEESASWE